MSDPNLRMAGQKSYELGAGESLDMAIWPDFQGIVAKAAYAANRNQKTTVRLMFEVEQ